uniref:XPG N-terminal domain-containing protein n=1 Tax=Setaria viridis TaxID=4556 RepID=A0A4U6SQR4_SETVI|nr:hypothetical protein SEVIR_9G021900v2 [Setaria viridis]
MGIKGLTKLLAEHTVQRRVEDYRGRVIAVDASLSIYQFLVSPRLVRSPPLFSRPLGHIAQSVRKFMQCVGS